MKKQLFLPYSRQQINQDDIEAVSEVLKSDFLTQGPIIEIFEKDVAHTVESKYSIATNSATSALHIACIALGLKKGDILWTSPITFVASANCAKYCGANVSFVDIDEMTGLISIEKLKEKLELSSKEGNLPKILVPVHLTGSSCDMEEIYKLSKKYDFKILEDASHAIGGTYKNKPVGNCIYSDITVFSFHPVKIITSGEGGVATTNDESLFIKLKELRSHGITKDEKKFKVFKPDPWAYEQQDLGFNYRITDIQAALGISQLKRLSKIVKERNKQHIFYAEILESLPITLLKVPKDVYSSFHLQVIQIELSKKSYYRKIFMNMREAGIGVQLHYIPVHLQPYYKQLGFKKGMYPNSELYANRSISIPLYPGLKKEQQIYVKETLESILNKI